MQDYKANKADATNAMAELEASLARYARGVDRGVPVRLADAMDSVVRFAKRHPDIYIWHMYSFGKEILDSHARGSEQYDAGLKILVEGLGI